MQFCDTTSTCLKSAQDRLVYTNSENSVGLRTQLGRKKFLKSRCQRAVPALNKRILVMCESSNYLLTSNPVQEMVGAVVFILGA
jgi:hypothetical protein